MYTKRSTQERSGDECSLAGVGVEGWGRCFKTPTSLHCFFLFLPFRLLYLLDLLGATYLKLLEWIKMAQARKAVNVRPIILEMFDPDVYSDWVLYLKRTSI